MNLVNNIKALCEVKKLSISDLETKLNFSRSSISKWDKSQPTISRVLQVADLFDVSVDFLCKSEFYKEKDLTTLFIDTLIKKTSEETIQWTFLNSQDSEHDKIRYTNELYDHFNIEYLFTAAQSVNQAAPMEMKRRNLKIELLHDPHIAHRETSYSRISSAVTT